MNVIIVGEYSGIVREAFRKKGHNAWSCDLLPTEQPGNHYKEDCMKRVVYMDWDLMIAHPPCTFLANSGVRWLYEGGKRFVRKNGVIFSENKINKERYMEMVRGAKFFNDLLSIATIRKIGLENPIQHEHARKLITHTHTQIIEPYMFGHLEKKATCLWLKGLPPLVETNNVYDEMMKLPYSERAKIHYASPGPDRWKERSRTYTGIANAMAEQWG